MRKIKNFTLLIPALFFISCASNPKTLFKKGILCGLIVDENNKPVCEYGVSVSTCNTQNLYYTNEKGIFYVPEIETGKVWIEGEKNGYEKINEEIVFTATQKIYCWQVSSMENALKKVEKLLFCGDFENAEKQLASIKVDKKSVFYKQHQRILKEINKKNREIKKNEK